MKNSNKIDNFRFPENEDISDVNGKDIIMKLSEPSRFMGTKRMEGFYSFSVDLSNIIGLM